MYWQFTLCTKAEIHFSSTKCTFSGRFLCVGYCHVRHCTRAWFMRVHVIPQYTHPSHNGISFFFFYLPRVLMSRCQTKSEFTVASHCTSQCLSGQVVLFLQPGNDFICGSFSLPSLLSEVMQRCNAGSTVLKTPQALQSDENTTACKWCQGRPVVIFNPSIFYLFAANFELHFVKQVAWESVRRSVVIPNGWIISLGITNGTRSVFIDGSK